MTKNEPIIESIRNQVLSLTSILLQIDFYQSENMFKAGKQNFEFESALVLEHPAYSKGNYLQLLNEEFQRYMGIITCLYCNNDSGNRLFTNDELEDGCELGLDGYPCLGDHCDNFEMSKIGSTKRNRTIDAIAFLLDHFERNEHVPNLEFTDLFNRFSAGSYTAKKLHEGINEQARHKKDNS